MRRIRDAISGLRPEIFVRRVENPNPRQTFGPISRKVSWNDQSHGKSIEHGKRLVVHQIRDNAFIQDWIPKIERFEKKVRAETLGALSGLKALKLHLQRAALYTGHIENVAQPHSGPHGVRSEE